MTNQPGNEEAIFLAALEIETPEERVAYVDRACASDANLRQRVLELLKSHHLSKGPFDVPPPGLQATSISPEISAVGDQIGSYKLLEQIGEGGFGIVYMADQQAPVRRRVALKIIKPGMDTKQVLARFKAELQALSLMDHPNIARALDAGATDSGRPYFVMELVRGVPITEYCDQNNLDVRQRLDLFVTVCHAVQHAHQKGIIHRDIKPSNVLVTMHDGRPVPKVIDFGVAKAINQQLTPETIFTRFAEMIGTPLYMSPEQAEMTSLDIDTRSDIYSLGVLLYELLTGSTPFERERLKNAAFDEIRRIIREEEPAKPSTRISTLGATSAAVAAHRHSSPNLLGRLMRGDLDWIVMKALEKDRTRRYETANGLAMDLQRHLADEPVLAGPPSATYRFHKFARRNRAALAIAAVVLCALLLGIVGTTWQAIRAQNAEILAEKRYADEQEARREAVENLQRARTAVDKYFTLVSESELLNVPGLQPLRKKLLDAALQFYQEFSAKRSDDPELLGDLAATYMRVAEINHSVDRNNEALGAINQCLDLIDRLRREFPHDRRWQQRLAGYWKGYRLTQSSTETPSDRQAASQTLRRAIDTWQVMADENPEQLAFQSDLASLCGKTGLLYAGIDERDAVQYYERSRAILNRLVRKQADVREHRADLARVNFELVGPLNRAGRTEESALAQRECLSLSEVLVVDFPGVPQYRCDLVRILPQRAAAIAKLQPVEAETMSRRAVGLGLSLVRDFPDLEVHHQRAGGAVFHWGEFLRGAGRKDEFDKLIQDVDTLIGQFPEDQKSVHLLRTLADLYRKQGNRNEALKFYNRAVAVGPKKFPNGYGALGLILYQTGFLAEAETCIRKLIESFPNWSSAHHHLGMVLKARGRLREAENAFRTELELYPEHSSSLQELMGVLAADGRKNEIKALLQQLRNAGRKQPWELHVAAAKLQKSAGQFAEAEASFRLAVEVSPNIPWPHHEFGLFLYDRGRLEEAEACFRKEIEINPRQDWAHHEFGKVLRDRGRLDEAEACFRKEIEINPKHFWSHFDLGDMLFAAGKVDEAVACYRKVAGINPQEGWAQQKASVFLFAHGSPGEAEAIFRRNIEAREKLVAEFPKNLDYQMQLAHCHNDFATTLKSAGRFAEAEQEYRQAVALKGKLVADSPANPDYCFHLAHSHLGLAYLFGDTKRPEEAEKHFRQGLALFQKLADDFAGEPARRHELANRYNEHGNFLAAAGRLPDAETVFRRSIEIYQQLITDFPGNSSYREGLGHTARLLAGKLDQTTRAADREKLWSLAAQQFEASINRGADSPSSQQARFYLADTYRALGRKADAEAAYRDALALWEKLVAESPSNAGYRWNLAGNREAIARLLSETGRKADAEAAYRDALGLWEKLVAESPTNVDYRWHLAVAHDALGNLLKDAGRFQNAAEAYRHALPLWEKLSAETHADDHRIHLSWTRGWLVESLVGRAKQLESGAKPSEAARKSADQAYRDAIAVWEKPAADAPKNDSYRAGLGHTLWQVADVWAASGRRDEAESAYRRALSIFEKLAAEFPKNLDYQLQLAGYHHDFANRLKAAGRTAEVEQGYRQALALKEKLVADSPANPDYRFHLAHTYLGLAYLFRDTKRPEEAEKDFRQALSIFEKLAADFPSRDNYRLEVGHTLWHLGWQASAAGRPAEAEKSHRQALAVFEKLGADVPANAYYRVEQGFSHWNLGGLLAKDIGRLHDAAESYRKALALYAKLSADFPNDAELRSRLARSHVMLIDVLLLQNKHAEAARLAVALPRVHPGKWDDHERAAGYLEHCAAIVQKDESLSPSDRKAVVEAYGKQAEELRREVRERSHPGTASPPGPRPKSANAAGTKPQETPSPEAKKEDKPAK